MRDMAETTPVKLDNGAIDGPMTAKQAAAYLQISWQKLRDWETKFGLPVHRLGNGPKAQRRFYKIELDQWLRSRWTYTPAANGDKS